MPLGRADEAVRCTDCDDQPLDTCLPATIGNAGHWLIARNGSTECTVEESGVRHAIVDRA